MEFLCVHDKEGFFPFFGVLVSIYKKPIRVLGNADLCTYSEKEQLTTKHALKINPVLGTTPSYISLKGS